MDLLYKNQSGQKLAVHAWNNSTNTHQTGDAANITAQVSIDGAATAATNDTNPTELDATDAPGVYLFDLTQAETNGDLIVVSAKSSTANVTLEPRFIYTLPNFLDDGTATFDRTTDSLQAQTDAAIALSDIRKGIVLQETTIATRTSQTIFTLAAGAPDADAYPINSRVVIIDQTTAQQVQVGLIASYMGSTRQVTLQGDPAIFTHAVGDTVIILGTSESPGGYWAKLDLVQDSSNDEYTVVWFAQDRVLNSGITGPKIQVIRRSDGTDLIASSSMSQIGSTGYWKYNEPTNRITDGEAVIVVLTAGIDGATRTWAQVVGRDV